MEKLSDYKEAQKWLGHIDWDNDPEADDNLATICYALQEIEKYKDLEKKGKLLELPCRVGDTVYEICEGFIEPCTVEVIFFADYKDKDGNPSCMMEIHYDREDCPWVLSEVFFTDIGKTVFLTEEEAGTALIDKLK